MISNFKVQKKEYLFILFFSFFIILFANYLLIPPDSHYYVANLDNAPNSIVKSIYEIIRSPLYTFYGIFYNSYILYFFATVIHIALLLILFYRSLIKTNESNSSSLIILLCFSPLTFRILNTLSNLESLELFQPILMALNELGPTHFGWASQGFTPRIYSGILLLLIFNNLIRSKYITCGILSIILFLCHPNNAISILSWFSLFLIIKYFFNKVSLVKISKFFALTFLGLIFAFILINEKTQILPGGNQYYSFDWYSNSYHINASNFSGLYYIINESLVTFIRIGIILLISSLSYKYLKSKYAFDLFLLSIVPVFLFFITVFIELFISNEIIEISILNRFVISGQFGLKILDLSFFPLILFIGLWFKNFNSIKFNFNHIVIFFIVIFLSNFSNYKSSIDALYYNYNYDQTLEKISEKTTNPMLLPIMNLMNGENISYNDKFSNYNNFIELKEQVLINIPRGSLIIVPPYQDKFRDLLIDYEIFYQDVPDASLFLGGGNSSEILKNRFKLLFNLNFNEFSSQNSGMYWTDLRNEFINLDKQSFVRIKNNFSNMKIFLITESDIKYDFNLIFSNKSYSLFEL